MKTTIALMTLFLGLTAAQGTAAEETFAFVPTAGNTLPPSDN